MPTIQSNTLYHDVKWIPAEKLKPILREWLKTNTIDAFCTQTGYSHRRLYTILQEQELVSFRVADRILTGLGLVELWHTDLAEFY